MGHAAPAVDHQGVGVQAKRQQHGLLQPLPGHPFTVQLLGNADLARVQQVDGLDDGFADEAGGGVANLGALFPRRVDSALQVSQAVWMAHAAVSLTRAAFRNGASLCVR